MKVRVWDEKGCRERDVSYVDSPRIRQIIPAEPGAYQVAEVFGDNEKERGWDIELSPVVAWALVEDYESTSTHDATIYTRVVAMIPGWDDFEPSGLELPDAEYHIGIVRTGVEEDMTRIMREAAEFWERKNKK